MKVEQVGGDHYQAYFQHWDMVTMTRVGYLEGNATKYISRWRKKGKPVEDLQKAKSYVDKIISLHSIGEYGNSSHFVSTQKILSERADRLLKQWFIEMDLTDDEIGICEGLARWKTTTALEIIQEEIAYLLSNALNAPNPTQPPPTAKKTPCGGAQGAGVGLAASSTSTRVGSFGPCPCGCGHERRKGQYFASDDCECPGHKYATFFDKTTGDKMSQCLVCGEEE